jgi:hypothetical protein
MAYAITNEDKKILSSHYREQRDTLLQELDSIKEKIAIIDIKLAELESRDQPAKSVHHVNGYDKNWNWNQKIRYVLIKKGKLSRGGIVDAILSYEPEREEEKASIANSIGATLSVAATKETSTYGRKKGEDNSWIYFAK